MQLPARRKAQMLADLITGETHSKMSIDEVSKQQLGESWLQYYIWIHEKLQKTAITAKELLLEFYHELVLDEDLTAAQRRQRENHYQMITQVVHTPIAYPSAELFVPTIPPLEWLWPDWMIKRMVSLLVAEPGTGKSYIALDIARRIINGEQYPDGQPVQGGGDVIFVDGENVPTLFKQRVRYWSAEELRHIYIMLPSDDQIIINLDEQPDRDRLWDMVWTIRPQLIIVDSYGSVTMTGENNKEDVQNLLSWFTRLARDFDTTILIVHHLRKRSTAQTSYLPMRLDSIRGSSHITAIARNVIGLQRVPTDADYDPNGPLRMWVMKSNAGPHPEALGVDLSPNPRDPDIAEITYSDQAPSPYKEPTKTDQAADWLEYTLSTADEALSPSDVIQWAEEEGHSRRTIYRARKRLPIADTESKHSPENKWEWSG